MNIHKNKKLFDLATTNSQKNALKVFFSQLDDEIVKEFSDCSKLYYPEIQIEIKSAISKCFHLTENKIEQEEAEILITSNFEKAKKWFIKHTPLLNDEMYFVSIRDGDIISFNNENTWVSKLPIFELSLNKITKYLEQIILLSEGNLVFSSISSESNLVMQSSGGYLEEEPSEKEVIYELAFWTKNG